MSRRKPEIAEGGRETLFPVFLVPLICFHVLQWVAGWKVQAKPSTGQVRFWDLRSDRPVCVQVSQTLALWFV